VFFQSYLDLATERGYPYLFTENRYRKQRVLKLTRMVKELAEGSLLTNTERCKLYKKDGLVAANLKQKVKERERKRVEDSLIASIKKKLEYIETLGRWPRSNNSRAKNPIPKDPAISKECAVAQVLYRYLAKPPSNPLHLTLIESETFQKYYPYPEKYIPGFKDLGHKRKAYLDKAVKLLDEGKQLPHWVKERIYAMEGEQAKEVIERIKASFKGSIEKRGLLRIEGALEQIESLGRWPNIRGGGNEVTLYHQIMNTLRSSTFLSHYKAIVESPTFQKYHPHPERYPIEKELCNTIK
jgi:hypothetical protein